MPLKIGAGDVSHIHDHAREAYPEECSGVMVGMKAEGMKVVVDIWRAENIHEEERSRRFLIDPLEYMKFEEQAGERWTVRSRSETTGPAAATTASAGLNMASRGDVVVGWRTSRCTRTSPCAPRLWSARIGG